MNHTSALRTLASLSQEPAVLLILEKIQKDFDPETYRLEKLLDRYSMLVKPAQDRQERLVLLEQAAAECISQEEPKWEEIAGRILAYDMEKQVRSHMEQEGIHTFYDWLVWLTDQKRMGAYILEHYTRKQVETLERCMVPERNDLLSYSALDLLKRRYLLCDKDHQILETPQEMFLLISMHLAMEEKDPVCWAKRYYDMLSTLKVTMATPTLSNARRPFYQMSSCFVDTMEDSLNGIYKSLDCFAQVSKRGGGMGIYMGKVRPTGSSLQGFEGAAGGILRWTKLINDTAIAVDQLGVRQGAAAVYLDIWHMDLPEFLQLKTNNGDERMKAHDIFPALCIPDLFWEQVRDDLESDWTLLDPHEILLKKGYALEDLYGEAWEEKYKECLADPDLKKRVLPIKEVVRLIIRSQVETGTPFLFNRDTVNNLNPNAHAGMIYCSNLCTEIAQNTSAMHTEDPRILHTDQGDVIVQETIPGDLVTCNLASLNLGRMNVHDEKELEETITSVMRALDSVIDLNDYPLPQARITAAKYRPVGLGTSGYQHLLAKEHIPFESEEHLRFMDSLYEKINYYALKASCQNAKEKGSYPLFEGSDYQTGAYFEKRNYTDECWTQLKEQIQRDGLRNGYLLAIAPTSSTSIIAGTTPGIDPLIHKFYLEEKRGSIIARVAPDLGWDTMWYYKNAHYIDQKWIIEAAGIRQRHLDQSQSVNLYVTNEYTYRSILNLLLLAWEKGLKTLYYIRSRSLEVEECESCAS